MAEKKIRRLIKGLQIIEAYSNDICVEDHQLLAGPVVKSRIPEEDQKKLESLDWFFEDNDGWTFYVG